MSNDKLTLAYKFYLDNKDHFIKKYENTYIAINENGDVIETGTDKLKVTQATVGKGYILGEFLVHFVSKTEDAVQRFHSRVAI